MRRPFSTLVAVTLAAGCSDQPLNDQPLLGPTLSPMAPATAEVDVPRAPLRASEGASDVAVGTSSIDAGVRMFWDPAEGAFRAGRVTGTHWDDANLGSLSFAVNYNTIASGFNSTAMGWGTTASGGEAVAMGEFTTASGAQAVAMGTLTTASGASSTAMGTLTTAGGSYATAMGEYTSAQPYASVAVGRFNEISGNPSSWVATDALFVIGNGDSPGNRHNALTVLKNGNTTIDGNLTITGSCTGCGGGITDHGNLVGLGDDDHQHYVLADGVRNAENGFAVTGTLNVGSIPVEGGGVRLMWYPRKGAFRAGRVTSTQWDDPGVGYQSVAMGINTTASGDQSTALGLATTANGDYSTAMGYQTTASGGASTALGWETTASNSNSTALGVLTTASGNSSTAMGRGTTASASNSTAMGWGTTASSPDATALGRETTASGGSSTAMGSHTTASGYASTALGYNTTAQAYESVALGRYNEISGSSTSWVATDPLFVIGNGDSPSTSNNAVEVLKNGTTTIDSVLTVMGTTTINGTLVLNSGCVGCDSPSDQRLKQNVAVLSGALAKISLLRGMSYDWRDDAREAEIHPGPQIGVVAQDVEQVFPELVGTDSRGYKYVRYQKLVAPLIEAVKELKAENDTLRAQKDAEVAELRALVADLAATVQHLQSAMAGIEQ